MAASPTAKRRPRSSRSKRDDIIYAAIEYFGQHGYEYTKWADIAKEVGIGSTALYHYFESKLHCLYEIQALAAPGRSREVRARSPSTMTSQRR